MSSRYWRHPDGIVHSGNASSKETAMRLDLDAPVLALQSGQLITLDDARGTCIQSRCGTLWVTEEGEHADFILGPGETLVLARSGRALVQAMVPARVALLGHGQPAHDAN